MAFITLANGSWALPMDKASYVVKSGGLDSNLPVQPDIPTTQVLWLVVVCFVEDMETGKR